MNSHPQYDNPYDLQLPICGSMTKQAVLSKSAFPPLLAVPLLMKLLGTAFAAKGVYDIGTKNVPGMLRNIGQGNWGGAARELGGAGMNALLAYPGSAMVGRLARIAGSGHNIQRGAGMVNTGAKAIMASRAGQAMLPAAGRLASLPGPRWLMRPTSLLDTAKFMGTSVGLGVGGEYAARALGDTPGAGPMVQSQNMAYPFLQQPGMLARLRDWYKRAPMPQAAQYAL